MVESMSSPITRCPWCSAPLPDTGVETCPSCRATLTAAPGTDAEIKGVTTLDTEAILRARSEIVRPRSNRLISFITGEVPAEPGEAGSPESLAAPSDDVRREMLRLQLEAERADLVAEAVALKSDELARRGIHLSELADDEPAEEQRGEAEDGVAGEASAAPSDVPEPPADPPAGGGPEAEPGT